MSRRRRFSVSAAIVFLALSGCGGGVDETYGRARSRSVNGTAVFADMVRARGHEVRTAVRLTDELKGWANVIVRFSQTRGGPAKDEAQWYAEWLAAYPSRRLVYVPHDYDAALEYWTLALDQLPPGATDRQKERIEKYRKETLGWQNELPPGPKDNPWFEVEVTKTPTVCQRLGGPWASGVDASKAALTVHDTIKLGNKRVLLSGDGKPIGVDWGVGSGGRILVVASAVFLLNVPLTEQARRPLAFRTIRWAEGDDDDRTAPGPPPPSVRVAFVEGPRVRADAVPDPSVFSLLKIWPFGGVAAQLFVLGLAACLAKAPRLGRPRPAPPAGADRPVAHPEALGLLLARTRQAREARSILETYRQWRTGPGTGRGAPAGRDRGGGAS